MVGSLSLSHGGVTQSVRLLCKGLSQRGHDIEIWTTPRGYHSVVDAPMHQELQSQGIKLSLFSIHANPSLGNRYALSRDFQKALHTGLGRFDLVHIHGLWLFTTWSAARECRKQKIPYLVSPCGSLDPYAWRRNPLFKILYGLLLERKTLAGARNIHFTSPFEEALAFRFGVKTPTVIVPRGLELEEIPNPPPGQFLSQDGRLKGKPFLLFLGRLHPKKRLDRVAQIFHLLAQQDHDLHLVLAGPDEGGVAQVRRILKEGTGMDRVVLTGLLAGLEKWAAYRDSSLFLLPSEDENFGLAALEAMAMGTPVAISKKVGLSYWIARTQGSGLVLEGSPALWTQAIAPLLRDPSARNKMGLEGRQLVEKEFTSAKIAADMEAVYARIR